MRDETPPVIEVWVCPRCGFWRPDKGTGLHLPPRGRAGERHALECVTYVASLPELATAPLVCEGR